MADKSNEAEWVVVPTTDAAIEATAERCRKLVTQRAMIAAGVAMVPVPGLDWVTDVGMLVKLLPMINAEFGLSPGQIERLAPDRRLVVFKVATTGGGMLVGRIVTRELVMTLLRLVGVRLTTQQAAKYVPIAGQLVSAALTFSALKYVCEQHIRQCMEVARQLRLPAPTTTLHGQAAASG
jgi:uncharacterized protein (DUF697 family)